LNSATRFWLCVFYRTFVNNYKKKSSRFTRIKVAHRVLVSIIDE